MRNWSRYSSLLILAFLPCFTVSAQDPQAGEGGALGRDTDFTLTLAKVAGMPGTEVNMPVTFASKPRASQVTKVRIQVSYPSAVIQFNRIEDAYLSRRVGLQVQGKEDNSEAGNSMLEMNFELPDPVGTKFPSGQIATLWFNIAADAAEGIVPMNPDAWIDGERIMQDSPTAKIVPGHIEISQTPVFVGCFLFTH